MTLVVFYKLLAILFIVVLGWGAGRMHWLGTGNDASDPARVLSNAALYIFIPALLLRTTVRLDFATLPWRTVGAFFVPAVALLLAVYSWQRLRGAAGRDGPAAPAVRARSLPASATRCNSAFRWPRPCSAKSGSRSTWR